MSVRAELIVPGDIVEPGDRAVAVLLVRNESRIVDAYDLELLGLPAAWTKSPLGRVAVFPGASTRLEVQLAPPRSPDLAPGTVVFGVKASSTERPGDISVPEGRLQVGEFLDADVVLRRGTVKGRTGAQQFATVRNTGNSRIVARVNCTPVDDNAPVDVTARHTRVALNVGERARVRLDIQAARPVLHGSEARHPMRLTVTWGGHEETHDFEYVQTPFATKRMVKIGSVCLAAAAAATALWVSPIGGQIEPRVQNSAGVSQQQAEDQKEAAAAQGRKDQKAAADQAEQQKKDAKAKEEQDKKDAKAKEEQQKKDEAEKAKAPKQKDLQESLSAHDGNPSAVFTVPKDYELRLGEMSTTSTGSGADTWAVETPSGVLATGGVGTPYDHLWKNAPFVVAAGGSVTLKLTCVPAPPNAPPTASAQPAPTQSPPPAPPCVATAVLYGVLVPTTGPFASPLPRDVA